jgi:hypothetical protein
MKRRETGGNREAPSIPAGLPGGWIVLLSVGALVLLFGPNCGLFRHRDTTPPLVAMVAPLDSAILLGTITLQADATDSSSGILSVEFLVDGDSVGPVVEGEDHYQCNWNSTLPAANTWHTVSARATDSAGNVGFSDSVRVLTTGSREFNVSHGMFSVPAESLICLSMSPLVGDSLVGDAQVAGPDQISDFFWCDNANFELFTRGDSFSCFDRQSQVSEVRVASNVPATGGYRLVFRNLGAAPAGVWARFVLRRRS